MTLYASLEEHMLSDVCSINYSTTGKHKLRGGIRFEIFVVFLYLSWRPQAQMDLRIALYNSNLFSIDS